MVNVEAVFEGGVLLLGNLDELFDKGTFGYGEGLGDDDIVTFGEEGESVLDKL